MYCKKKVDKREYQVDEMGTGVTALMLYVSSSGSKGKMATYLESNMPNQLVQKFIKCFLWWLFFRLKYKFYVYSTVYYYVI